ncbi:MAG: hypothetical protein NVSMB18_31470 [Acetobacteraceae bacterium]
MWDAGVDMDTVLRTEEPGWQARIEGQASLADAQGLPQAGTEYTIGLLRDGDHQIIRVHALLADDLTPAARADRHYQGRAVLRQIFARLEMGWIPPPGDVPLVLTIENPDPAYRHPGSTPRRSFIDRMTGRPRP